MTKKNDDPKPAPPQAIDEAGEESFPASDPPAWTTTHAGGPAPGADRKPRDRPAKEPAPRPKK